MIKDQTILPANPFKGRDSKEVWRELRENSVPVNKEEFFQRAKNHFSKQDTLGNSAK